MAYLALSLLGPFQVTLDGRAVTGFASDKVRALLAYLAVEADRPHRRQTLAGLLWPEWPESTARTYLRNALSNLRQTIDDHRAEPPFLLITREALRFNLASDHWLDVSAFTDQLATQSADQLTIHQLEAVVSLYRGPFLEGFSLKDSLAFEDWSLLTRERLLRQVLEALHRLAGYYEVGGYYRRACEVTRRQVELEPWQEQAHQRLMHLLALSGQRSAALAQYETCCRLLRQELDVEPTAETTRLYRRIRDGEAGALGVKRHNLPAPLTPLVGRERELSQLRERLQDPACRLLSLIGPGGSGKTRLALEAAADLLSHGPNQDFSHGVYFVSLAPVTAEEAIVGAMAQALGFSFFTSSDRRGQLLSYLRRRRLLLILDNFEHLLDPSDPAFPSAVGLVADVLRTASEVKILVTSRARLNARGEHVYPVHGMDFPEQETAKDALQFGAVQLFLQSARRVNPGFEATANDLTHIVHICQLVQGMPLALLLAAAWTEVLSSSKIAQQIASQSIDFLATDWRDVPARQRSMRAVFDHSWNLLTQRQQDVLAALSIFRGGFTQQAAEQVTGASLRELKRLVDRSLLLPASAGRYELHELVRQYAAEKLGQSASAAAAARDRHSAYYCAALEGWWADFQGPQQQKAYAAFVTDRENVRLAWAWAAEKQHVACLDRATEGLYFILQHSARYLDGEATCRLATSALAAGEHTASHPDAERPVPVALSADRLRVWAKILAYEATFNRQLGRIELSDQQIKQSQALLERPELADRDIQWERMVLLTAKAFLTRVDGAPQEARRLAEESLAICRIIDARWMAALALWLLGDVACDLGLLDEAHQRYTESLGLFRALGSRGHSARLTTRLSGIALLTGQLEQAERLAREGSALYREIALESGNQLLITAGFPSLAQALRWQGRFSEALALHAELVANFEDLESRFRDDYSYTSQDESPCLDKMHLGQYQEARVQAERILAFAREGEWRGLIGGALWVVGSVALAQGAYDEARRCLQECAQVYRDNQDHEALGRALAVLAYASHDLGQFAQMRHCLCQALHIASEIGAFRPAILALPALAVLLADQGEAEWAVELYALASRYPFVSNSRWFKDVAGKQIAAVAATLPAQLVAAAQERGRARDLQTTVAELLDEFSAQGQAARRGPP